MTTVYDGGAVVNPVHGQLGAGKLDLYDWLRLRGRMGRTRCVEELTPPGAPRYEQLTEKLRKRIFTGDWPDKASGPFFAKDYGVSQPIVQRAFEALEREGLVQLESGRRTTVLPRQRWLISFEGRLPLDDKVRDATVARVRDALRSATGEQPAISEATAERSAIGVVISMIVEAAEIEGAQTAAFPIARRALGDVPRVAYSAREA